VHPESTTCVICEKSRPLTLHHLIPKKLHRRPRFQRLYPKEELVSRAIPVCRRCHSFLHRTYDEMELGTRLNTQEALLADPTIAKFATWARKQKD
jgi:5-methylcytosine-specific restriction endonuclease McrA